MVVLGRRRRGGRADGVQVTSRTVGSCCACNQHLMGRFGVADGTQIGASERGPCWQGRARRRPGPPLAGVPALSTCVEFHRCKLSPFWGQAVDTPVPDSGDDETAIPVGMAVRDDGRTTDCRDGPGRAGRRTVTAALIRPSGPPTATRPVPGRDGDATRWRRRPRRGRQGPRTRPSSTTSRHRRRRRSPRP